MQWCLLSGGLDSATVLAIAPNRVSTAMPCRLITASGTARNWMLRERGGAHGAILKTVKLDLRTIGGSALTDDIDVPEEESEGIPVTYVPARNTIMLSLALAWAEVLGADDIFIGVNAVDYSGYPGLPARVHQGLSRKWPTWPPRRVWRAPTDHPHTVDRPQQGGHHPPGNRTGRGLRMTVSCYQADDEGQGLRRLRFLPDTRSRIQGGGRQDPTRYKSA